MIIKTIGELKKAIKDIDDDFSLDIQIARERSEDELEQMKYKYPYECKDAELELSDVGYSDRLVVFYAMQIGENNE